MEKVTIEVDVKQLEKIIERLPQKEQKRLAEKLWKIQMENILKKVRKAATKNKITEKKIKEVCEEVRQEIYEKKIKSGN